MSDVVENTAQSRFEMTENGLPAWADYRRQGDRLVIPHVEAHPDLRGSGAAGRLMEGVLGIARRDGLKVVPLCGYASAYIRRHKEHHDLLA